MITPSSLKNNNIAVIGLGKAGISTINALHRANAQIYAWDDNESSRNKLINLDNVHLQSPEKMPWEEISLLVMSPGIPLTHPKPHIAVELAKKYQCKIICDIELLYLTQNIAKFIGITGTNGKSTTTSLTGHILKSCGVKTEIGGNIGIPALDLETLNKDGVYVIEMSSYQLDLIDKTHFNISILLNITPDHLDRHGGLEGYIAAKCHIYDQQGKEDTAIICIDDSHTHKIYEEQKAKNKIGNIIPISIKEIIANGVTVKDGIIYDSLNGETAKHNLGFPEKLPGIHNSQNIAAAYAASRVMGLNSDDIISATKSFSGLRHRIQIASEIDGIKFINDSKATNADAASNALRAYDEIYWIAGGQAKEGGISSLKEFFPKIRHAFLIGQAENDFAKTLDGHVEYTKCGTLKNAFEKSSKMALIEKRKNAVILFSPACASWDQWPNFEVRGDAFCAMAEELALQKNK